MRDLPISEGDFMLILICLLIWRSIATAHGYIHAYAPTNIAIAHLRTRGGLKWAIPVAVVAVPSYLYLAYLMTVLVYCGASNWLLVVMLVCFVDACKFGALALLTPLLWARAAVRALANSRHGECLPRVP